MICNLLILEMLACLKIKKEKEPTTSLTNFKYFHEPKSEIH